MMKYKLLFLAVICAPSLLLATIFGNVRGVVRDPQQAAIPGAEVVIRSQTSDWKQTAETNAAGEFEFDAVPLGRYTAIVTAKGFAPAERSFEVTTESSLVLTISMKVQAIQQSVEVSAAPEIINVQSSTAENLISRSNITEAPGADRTNSLSMITDFVPGAFMVHDQLHIRGGHQVTWEIDGVPVPNTNIASNVGPQFDPKDIDYLEVQRGGYSAEYGDRTYGVFNVATRTGFEGTRFGEFSSTFGNFYQTNNYLSFGSHTDRFAYFASLNGNRTDLGLETPTSQVLHDQSNGFGGFGSFIFDATPKDQLRLITSVRRDYFQVPNDPDQQASGIRDAEQESDALLNFSWVHTSGPGLLWTISPYYHFNRAHYVGGANDVPIIPEDDRSSNYLGGHVSLSVTKQRHNAQFGMDSFAQRDNTLFGITANDLSALALRQRELLWGGVEALFAEDQFKVASWLTLNAGLRYTHYSGSVSENALSPRLGTAIRIPKLGWALRGFYGRYYQAPPLSTVVGPLLSYALDQGFGFLPLKGERDEQWEVGLAIPLRAWALDLDYFHTRARNFFDHDALGNSNIFFPLTIDTARIHGWESTLRSPMLRRRLQLHWALSIQTVQGRGAVTGGLTDFTSPEEGFFYLDHDQRATLSTGFAVNLPARVSVSCDVLYGSGFLNGDGPEHLPAHTTADLSLSKKIGENWSIGVSALNIANRRYMLDDSNTFGGSHFANPREIFAQVRYRFHF